MSTSRIDPRAGWVSPTALPRGPEGRALCRECGAEVPRGRRTFCGDGCIAAWKIRTDPSFVRSRVFRRDRGVCRACGFDARYVKGVIADLRRSRAGGPYRVEAGCLAAGMLRVAVVWLLRAGFGSRWERSHVETDPSPGWRECISSPTVLWEADHIVPVVEGGGACGLDGYRTLCRPCHVRETAALRRRRTKQATLPGVS